MSPDVYRVIGISLACWIDSFQMKYPTAPFLGCDIRDRFGEVPAVAVEIFSIVLTLTIGLIPGFSQDSGAVLARALAMSVSIVDANLNDVRSVGRHISFRDGEAALTRFHLDAVVGDAKADCEAKSL